MYVKETTDTFLDSDNTENGDYFQAIISVGSVKSCFMIISFMPRSLLKNKKTSFDEPWSNIIHSGVGEVKIKVFVVVVQIVKY